MPNLVLHMLTRELFLQPRDSMNVHGQHWRGVNILVIHTYFWWFTGAGYVKILPGPFEDKVNSSIDVPPEDAYRMALESMLKWIEENIDTTKTRLFFNGISITHGSNIVWGGDHKGNCYNETIPVEDPNYNIPTAFKKTMRIVDEVLSKPNVQITFLNITRLSNYRKDAHVSMYQKQWRNTTSKNVDCIHWCLPGVPDTWSELLFAKLFYP
ncbi:PREDICTED: protein trichome birefringence-like 33 [Ipomoea nil]|uniref:protein trichome birefringence-like 33 n=1 Tax=Ipomoea nil TaxID=35883 RepID=UPI000900D9A8|nr:PREDICTED: protein trichome birefringence-like 33 [Ipomoea nil]